MRRLTKLCCLWLSVGGCYDGLHDQPAPGFDTVGSTGADSDRPAGDDDDTGADETGEPAGPECGDPQVGSSTVRRMTRLEYDNTVADLLGTSLRPAQAFVAEEEVLGFNNNGSALTVGELLVEQYMAAAETLAVEAVANLETLVPCDPAVGDESCARDFARTLGQRAYRRPLQDEQVDSLLAVYSHGVGEGGFASGIELMLQAMLQSPSFLYRIELGGADPGAAGVVRLDDWEMASRLSYLLWNSMPDEPLFAAAAAGELQRPDEIREQAERMLDDPRAASVVVDFHRQFFDLDALEGQSKDPVAFPEWNLELQASMLAEAERYAAHVVLEGDGSWRTLLMSDYTFLDTRLASFYGLGNVAGPELALVELAAGSHRGGMLRGAALHAALGKYATTAPVLRGKFVRTRLLCEDLPPPPDNVDFEPPDIDPNATARERYSEHTENAECAACHVLMDPIGFGFEHYDGAGRWRAVENGFPIDARGEIKGSQDADGEFEGVEGLADKLAGSEQARACVVTQWFRYAYGREESEEEDGCTMSWLQEQFEAGDVRGLILALTQTDAFRYVKVED